MDRKNFDKLDFKLQVDYINKKLSLGESLRKITADIGIQRKTIRERFKKINYVFNKGKNRYICNSNVSQNNIEDNNIILNDNIDNEFLQLLQEKDNLLNMLKWFNEYNKNKNIFKPSKLKIDRDKFEGEVKITTIRIYSNIKEKFQKFLKTFPEFKSQDIYTQSLLEFMENHKK